MGRPSKYSPEVRERAVRLVLEHQESTTPSGRAIGSIAAKIGCTAETLRKWVRQAERDSGRRPGLTTVERSAAGSGTGELRAEAGERDSAEGVGVFRAGGARPPTEVMMTFVEEHRELYGVEPICAVLPIAPSTYYEHVAREKDPERRPARSTRRRAGRGDPPGVDGELQRLRCAEGVATAQAGEDRRGPLHRGAIDAELGLRGATRGRTFKTTIPDDGATRPADLVARNFTATRPNQLWVADLTYVATWRGFVYVAFVIDVFSRRIVGWRASTSLRTEIALDALEQALCARPRSEATGAPQRPWSSIPMHPVHGAFGRSRDRAFGRQRGGFV